MCIRDRRNGLRQRQHRHVGRRPRIVEEFRRVVALQRADARQQADVLGGEELARVLQRLGEISQQLHGGAGV